MNLSDISEKFCTKNLHKIIQTIGGKNSVYKEMVMRPGFKKGDSYLSSIFRFKLLGVNTETNEELSVNVIVKSIPKNDIRRKLFRSNEFFGNEINFYTKVIPAFEEFQQSRNVQESFSEYVRCFDYYCDGQHDFIVLEDINIAGFEPPSRHNELTLENLITIMCALGKFHAVSLAFRDQLPEKFQEVKNILKETYYHEKYRRWYSDLLRDTSVCTIDAVSREFSGTIYEEKTRKFLDDKFYDRQIDFVSTESPLSVIGHGDCWAPNFLVRTRTNEAKLIDFQLARYASLALDVSFFLCTCADTTIRMQHGDEILRAYHESACKLIQELGSNPKMIFPYDLLKTELRKFGAFGCGFAIECIPIAMFEQDEVPDPDDLTEENSTLTDVWKVRPIQNPTNRRRLADIFKDAIDNNQL